MKSLIKFWIGFSFSLFVYSFLFYVLGLLQTHPDYQSPSFLWFIFSLVSLWIFIWTLIVYFKERKKLKGDISGEE